ncbi:MAG: TIGR02996 domain-containing protein [Kofleriaceae bacterium]
MARYINHDTRLVWEIELAGNVVTTTVGDETLTKKLGSASRAQAMYDTAIAQIVELGFVPDGAPAPERRVVKEPVARLRNPVLEAEILANIDDPNPYGVYADWLSEQGDWHGELIAMQLKGRQALIADHRDELFGDLSELSARRLAVTWRYGFIDRLRVEKLADSEDDDERTLAELISAVLALPIGAFVRELSVGLGDGVEDGRCHWADIWEVLAPGTCLKKIFVGEWDEFEVSWTDAGDISPVWKLPALESLTIRAGALEIKNVTSPTLRELTIITGGNSAENLRALAAAPSTCPALRKLHVYCGSQYYNATGGIEDLLPLFEATTILDLGVQNCEWTDSVCATIGTRPIAAVITNLDLSLGTMTGSGVASLVAARRAFRSLQRIDVSQNYLTAADLIELQKLGCTIVGDGQKSGDERYVTLGE